MKTIGQTARLAGVSPVTLRHYDKIGLLSPRSRSKSGYRLYGGAELVRLREILVWRHLGFPLSEIRALLDAPAHDHSEALRFQRDLVTEHLQRFWSIREGLDRAIQTTAEGRSFTDEDVFVGFANSLHEPSEKEPEPRSTRTPFMFLGSHTRGQVDARRDRSRRDLRVVAVDPVRMGECLLALGVHPVGIGTYEDDHAIGQVGIWPWPPNVEEALRRRIRTVGSYASDRDELQRMRPDLIFAWSNRAEGFEGLAPAEGLTVARDVPAPAFTTWLSHIARTLSLDDRAERLLRVWRARTAVLRAHVDGTRISVLNIWGDGPDDQHFAVPDDQFEAQIFSLLGLEVTQPREVCPDPWHRAIVEQPALESLSAPMLFVGLLRLAPPQINRLLTTRPLQQLPSVQTGRVFPYGWDGVRSGWFSAHWQLHTVARAFGIVQLCVADGEDPIHLALNPRTGKLVIAAARSETTLRLEGPGLRGVAINLNPDGTGELHLQEGQGLQLCTFPEAFSLQDITTGADHHLALDHESALQRLSGWSS